MRVLGIDPGTYKMGVGAVDSGGDRLVLAHADVIASSRKAPLEQRLYQLFDQLSRVVGELRPSVVAIEQPFAARNVRAAMAVGHAQAVAMLVAASQDLPVSTYTPRQVKQAVTDYGGSSKEQVQEMVRVLLELDDVPESEDAADALAVAICHVNASHVSEVAILE